MSFSSLIMITWLSSSAKLSFNQDKWIFPKPASYHYASHFYSLLRFLASCAILLGC